MDDKRLFEKLCECLELVWKGDDSIDQTALFLLQEKLADVCLDFASEDMVTELLERFPYVYSKNEEGEDS